MLKALQNKPIIPLTIIVVLMLAFSIDCVPVSIMEARNFITAREMLTDGNWLLTTMNGEARYEKPPLPTWMTAIFGWIFGLKSLLALRFPAIIFIAVIGIFIYLLSKKILEDKAHSFTNALIGITSFYVIGITLEAPWDIFTHGYMLIAIYHLFQLFQKQHQFAKHSILAGIFMGCSILCKGPISIYALLLPFVLAYGFTFRYKQFKPKLIPVLFCIILALIIGGWWYVYVRMSDPLTFEAIATRETNNWHSYNTKPFYYYWSFFTQSGIWTIPAFISLIYPYLKSKVSNLKVYQFSLLWTIFAVILLSLIPEKKSRYLMPVLIPLAINIGFYVNYLIRCFKIMKDKREKIPVYFNFGLIALIAILFPVALYFFVGEKLMGRWVFFTITTIITVSIGILILINLKKKNIQKVFMLTVAFFVAIFIFALPLLKPVIGTSNNPITNLEYKNLKIYGLNSISPEMIWQYGDKIPPLKSEDGSLNLPSEEKFGILSLNMSTKDFKLLQAKYEIQKVNTFDLNTVSPRSKRYNDRLVNEFYILTRL
ncbi:MAG: glycosyltransferase family 39 protein [Gelidibacter sp.]